MLTKEPLLLNFTMPGDANCNKLTQSLFDVLSDKAKYPLSVDKLVLLANIACDGPGGRELQQNYGVSKIPTIVLLKKQMVADRFVPKDVASEADLSEWIKSIY